MAGNVVPGAGSVRPSKHYRGHLAGVGDPLRSFVSGFIDGLPVITVDQLEVVPRATSATHALLVVTDTSVGADRSFVVMLQARTVTDVTNGVPQDPRGTPTLLDDIHPQPTMWQVYNCHIVDFTVWPTAKTKNSRDLPRF